MCDDGGHGHGPAQWRRAVPVEETGGRGRIPLEPVDAVTVTTLVDNVFDGTLPDQGPAHRVPLAAAPRRPVGIMEGGWGIDSLAAEHGFSVLITVEKGGHTHRVLFDAGMTPDALAGNMDRLGLAPADVEVVVLSHGHFDHTTGLDGFARALGRPANLPVVLHPAFFTKRRIAIPGRTPFELPTTSKRALGDLGFEVIEERQPSFLLDGSLLVTGEVERTTAFETGLPFHEACDAEGGWGPDPLILDDQAAVLHLRGKGLVVITGCGHAGIVNIVRHARHLTGVDAVHAVFGGFHLNGPAFAPVIPEVVAELTGLGPDVVVPAHCTGFAAMHALASALPEAFVPNSVGTRFELVTTPAPG